MKIILFTFFIVLSSTVSAKILECPRINDYQEIIEEGESISCNSDIFNQSATDIFEKEISSFQKDNLTPLLQDNVHDMKWLVRKSTQDLREHMYCLELLCKAIQDKCPNKENLSESGEMGWCNSRIENFGKIEQKKVRETVIENQKRKSQSNLREKMRAIEVRTLRLFIPQLQKFFAEYRFFTEKVPTFLSKPL